MDIALLKRRLRESEELMATEIKYLLFLIDVAVESAAIKKAEEQTSEECKHYDYRIETVMDLLFYVCNDCGFQWKMKQ